MGLKELLLCIEIPLTVLLLIEIVIFYVSIKRQKAEKDNQNPLDDVDNGVVYSNFVGANTASVKKSNADSTTRSYTEAPEAEPYGYVKGADAFLDRLTTKERIEFYNIFIYNSRCGLQYKPGEDNSEFFSGVFINLGGVSFVVSDDLMRKICIEYDRVRGLPVTAH